jgi:hypothetical protein
MQIWLPSAVSAARGAAFEVAVTLRSETVTHALEVPSADAAATSSISRRLSMSGVVTQSFSDSVTASDIAEDGSQFSITLRFQGKASNSIYIPVILSAALLEYNDSSHASTNAGQLIERWVFLNASTPSTEAREWTWTSAVVPVWPTCTALHECLHLPALQVRTHTMAHLLWCMYKSARWQAAGSHVMLVLAELQ